MDEEQEFKNFIRELYEREAEDDRAWFAAHPRRKYRTRALAPVESVDAQKSLPWVPLSTDSEPDAEGKYMRSGAPCVVRREDHMLIPLVPPVGGFRIRDNDKSLAKLFNGMTKLFETLATKKAICVKLS